MEKLGEFPFADFDGSLFNCSAGLYGCPSCDFVRVAFPFSDKELAAYYEQSDSLYTSLSGVGVGGESDEDRERYEYGLNILSAIPRIGSVVDVGCSKGGFMKYVRERTAWKVCGVEIDRNALAILESNGIPALFGGAARLPLPTGSQELMTYFHVLEHMSDVEAVISEIARVLAPEGHVLIEVPDAEHYHDARVGDWFWLAMKEHVNHFTAAALCRALESHGLHPLRAVQTLLPMKNGAQYPSLTVVAGKKSTASISAGIAQQRPLQWFRDYHRHETACFRRTRERLNSFLDGFTTVNCWGIGLEFLNLVAHGALLSDADRAQREWNLFDQNAEKRKKRVRDHGILPVNQMSSDGGLVISSYLRGGEMMALSAQTGRRETSVFAL
jgi:SAM-dependent methyltransferase